MVCSLASQVLNSVSKGPMKGEDRMVCTFTMWSSSSIWMSSTDDKMETPDEGNHVKIWDNWHSFGYNWWFLESILGATSCLAAHLFEP